MEPVFIYFDKVKFDDANFKIFTIKFSDADSLDGVLFRKTNDYYLISMTSSIAIEQNLKELKDYDDIKKISGISKAYLKNGIDHYQTFPLISSSVFSELFPYKKFYRTKVKEVHRWLELTILMLMQTQKVLFMFIWVMKI